MKYSFFLLLFALLSSQQIKCGSGFTPYETNGEDQYFVCENLKDSATFKPSLPRGLELIDGIMKGSPTRPFGKLRLRIRKDDLYGDWFLSSNYQLTTVGIGFNRQVVFKDAPLPFNRAFPDIYANEYVISPELPSDLEFDMTTGGIRGRYSGFPQVVDYTMSAVYKTQNVSTTFSFDYKNSNDLIAGYSLCYYPYLESDSFFSAFYYMLMPYDKCVTINEPLNFTEKFHIEHVHHWPGIPEFYDKQFIAKFDAYFFISDKNIYDFHIRGTNAIRLLIDSEKVIEMGYAGASYADSTGNMTLSAGYHLLTLYYNHYDLDAHLLVEYRQSGTAEWTLFSGENLFIAGYAPSFLKYDDIVTHVNSTLHVRYSNIQMGAAYKFTITPALPQGLLFDENTGTLSGTVTTVMNQVYTVTAEGFMGSCETTFAFLAGEAPIQGLRARYYAVDEAIDMWTRKQFYEHEMDLVLNTVDTSLSFPFTPRRGTWPGVPGAVFRKKAYIEWDGYLLFDEVGEWAFSFVFYDGLRVILDGERILNLFSCRGRENKVYHRIEINETRYYSLHIEFFTNDDDFQFDVKMMRPSEREYGSLPRELLSHHPPAVFSMSTVQTQLIKGKEMSSISPIIYSIPVSQPSFSVEPALPQGLTLSDSGVITGTPSQEFDMTVFTITLTTDGHTYETTLSLSCYFPPTPAEVFIKDSSGQSVTSITMNIFKESEEYSVGCSDESYCSIQITPSLPEGVTFNRVTGKLSGRPLKAYQSTCTITAETESGQVTTQFTLTVPSCEEGYYFYANTMGGLYDLTISKGSEVIFSEEGKTSSKYSSIFCIPKETYVLTIKNSTATQLSSFLLMREDGVKYFDISFTNSSFTAPLEVQIQTPPKLSFKAAVHYLMLKEPFKLYYEEEGLHQPPQADPSLPDDGFYLNEFERFFSGVFYRPGVYHYSIKLSNDAGTATVEHTFYVNTCPDQYEMFFGTRGVATAGDAFSIGVDGNTVTYRDLGFDTAERFIICLSSAPHTITIYTKTNSSSKYARPLIFRDKDNTVMATYMLDDQGEETYRISKMNIFNEEQSRYLWLSKKKVNKNWKEEDFNSKSWTLLDEANPPAFSDKIKTAYLRFAADFYKNDYVGGIVLYIKASAGFIMYINSVEAVRINLPVGEVDSSTLAFESVDLSDWYRVTLNPNLLHAGTNMIGVEMHCYANQAPSAQRVSFSAKSYQFQSRSLFLSTEGDGIPSGSTNRPDPSSKLENAFFDINDNTFWGDGDLPAWIRFTFVNQLVFVNKLMLRSAAKYGFDPVFFTVYGVRNHTIYENGQYSIREVKDTIKVVNNFYLFNNQTAEEITLFLDTQYPYQAYEMEIHQSQNGVDSVHINSIRMFSEKRYWCGEEKKWDAALGDTTSYGKCPFLKIGMSTRRCTVVNYEGVWEAEKQDTCLTRWAGKNEAFVDTSYQIQNCTLMLWDTVVEEAFRAVIVREVTVKEEEVFFYLPRICSSEMEPPTVCVDVRLRPHRLTSEYVSMELDLFNTNATQLFYKKPNPLVPENMRVIPGEDIDIRQRWSAKDISFTVTIAVMVILYLVLLVLYCRNVRTGRNSTRKTLKKVNKLQSTKDMNQQPLLKL